MTAIRHFRKERKKAENSSSLESVLYKFTLPSVPKRGREEEHIDPPAWREIGILTARSRQGSRPLGRFLRCAEHTLHTMYDDPGL